MNKNTEHAKAVKQWLIEAIEDLSVQDWEELLDYVQCFFPKAEKPVGRAAKKAIATGNREDLREYMELRRQ